MSSAGRSMAPMATLGPSSLRDINRALWVKQANLCNYMHTYKKNTIKQMRDAISFANTLKFSVQSSMRHNYCVSIKRSDVLDLPWIKPLKALDFTSFPLWWVAVTCPGVGVGGHFDGQGWHWAWCFGAVPTTNKHTHAHKQIANFHFDDLCWTMTVAMWTRLDRWTRLFILSS